MDRKKYITDLTKEEVDASVVIKCLDKDGKLCILIKNSLCKKTSFVYQTDNLMANFDIVLTLDDEEMYFHIITLKKTIDAEEQFDMIYDYIFKKIDSPMNSSELIILLKSIEELFKITPEKDNINFQIGVYGELFCLTHLYNLGYESIIEKYHDNFYTKHDVEINERIRLEIKSTIKEKRIHSFRHNQICRDDIDVFVCSVMLEYSKEGKTLYDLFMDAIKLYSNPDSIFSLKKLMKKCGVDQEKQGISISFEKANQDFKVFDAKSLPHIVGNIPNGVTNVEYDVDCELNEGMNLTDFIIFLNSVNS